MREELCFTKYVMQKYNSINVNADTYQKINSPIPTAEAVYMMGFFGYYPDEKLLETMMSNSNVTKEIKSILDEMDETKEKTELLKECFPSKDIAFAHNYLMYMKHYAENGRFESFDANIMVEPQKYSFIQRTKNGKSLSITTPEQYKEVYLELIQKDKLSMFETGMFIGLEKSCDLSTIAEETKTKDKFLETLNSAYKSIEINHAHEKKMELYREMIETHIAFPKIEQFKSIQDSSKTSDILLIINDYYKHQLDYELNCEKTRENYLEYVNGPYTETTGEERVHFKDVMDEIKDILSQEAYQKLTAEQEKEVLENANKAFEKSMTRLLEKQLDLKENSIHCEDISSPLFAMKLEEKAKELRNIIDTLDKMVDEFVEFRNKYYNPTFGLKEISKQDVDKWLDEYIDALIDNEEPQKTFIQNNNNNNYNSKLTGNLLYNIMNDILNCKKETERIFQDMSMDMMQKMQIIAEKQNELNTKINSYTELLIEFAVNESQGNVLIDDIIKNNAINAKNVTEWIQNGKHEQGIEPGYALRFIIDNYGDKSLVENVLDGNENLSVPATYGESDIVK